MCAASFATERTTLCKLSYSPVSMPREYLKLFVYAFIALPLVLLVSRFYIHLPQFYSQTTTLSLSIIGVVLFITRLVDCVLDRL